MNVKMLQTGPLGTNCYLLEDAQEAAVIDPGGDAGAIQGALEGAEPRYILLTHGHYDHTGGAAELKRSFPHAAVYIHQKDFQETDPRLFPLRTQVEDVNFYDEGDTLPLGKTEIHVLYTPGHSEGGVTLRWGDLLFCGDTLFAGSCGRTDFPGGSVPKLLASLRRLGELEGNLQVCPGHMDITTLEEERAHNPYLRQALREAP